MQTKANRVGFFIPAQIRHEETRRQRGNKFSLGSAQGTYSTSNAFANPSAVLAASDANPPADDFVKSKSGNRYKSHFTIDHPRADADVYGGVTVNGRFHNQKSGSSVEASRA